MQSNDTLYNDMQHVKISKNLSFSQSTHIVALCTCDVAENIGLLDQTTLLDKNK